MIESVEHAYECMAKEVLAFVDERDWSVAGAEYDVQGKSVGSRWWREFDGVRDERGDFPPEEVSALAASAVRFLRDDLLATTGDRIWGLTFTLYPDCNFNIEYDYQRPDWYSEDDERADIEAERADAGVSVADVQAMAQRLRSLGVEVEIDDPAAGQPGHALLVEAVGWLRAQFERLSQTCGLGSETASHLDMHAGTLRFSFADGRELVCPVQIVGTYNTADGSFLWGWDHPSVPEPLRRAASRVRELGQAQGIEPFTTRKLACSEADAWDYAAVAARLDGAAGTYRSRAGDAWVYMSFGEPEERPQDRAGGPARPPRGSGKTGKAGSSQAPG